MPTNYRYVATLKFLISIAMVVGHCVIYGAIYWPKGDFFGDSFFSFQLRSLSIAIVGCIPALAGLLHYYQQGHDKENKIASSLKILTFLFCIEGIKSVLLSHRYISFFHFDVLVLIGLSLFFIDAFKRLHRVIPILISVLLFFTNPFFEYFRGHFVFFDMKKYYAVFDIISWSGFLIFNFALLLIARRKFYLKRKITWCILVILSLLLSYQMFFVELKNPRLLYDFLNYPLGGLIGIHHASHVWPLLVWFPMIVFGFELGALLKRLQNNFLLLLGVQFLCLYYIYFYHSEIFPNNFFLKMNQGGLGNESVFFINSLRLALHCSILTLLVVFTMKMENILKFSQYKILGVISRWILFIYLASIFVAHYLAPILARHLDYMMGFSVLLLLSIFICYLGAYSLDFVFLRLKIRVKFEKIK